MRMRQFFSILLVLLLLPALASAGTWAKTYGGSEMDDAWAVQQTSDNGFIVAGGSYTYGTNQAIWIMKIDSNGEIDWQQVYNGCTACRAHSIQQVSGGFIVAGGVYSTVFPDAFVMKINNDGASVWAKRVGGSCFDEARSIQQTADGGFVMVGSAVAPVGSECPSPDSNVWVLKLDADGDLLWERTYDGNESGGDEGYAIQETHNGGFIVSGMTAGTSYPIGDGDAWIIKLESDGDVEWSKSVADSAAFSIQQTAPDYGFVVAGNSRVGGGVDAWVSKLSSAGNAEWTYRYGGSLGDAAWSIRQASDGGYIAAGSTGAEGFGVGDVLVLKLDSSGAISWRKKFAGESSEVAYAVRETTDAGFILAGWTKSFGAGNDDVLVLKLDEEGTVDGCDIIQTASISRYSANTLTSKDLTTADANATVTDMNALATGADADTYPICDEDSDFDGLSNAFEAQIGTNPNDDDSDNDGVDDGDEYAYWGETWNTNYDGDGISNNLLDIDADNDGYIDGYEINNGFDPTSPSSHPASRPVPSTGQLGLLLSASILLAAGLIVLKSRQNGSG